MDIDKKQIERWIGKHLSDETVESNTFEEWMWCADRHDKEELTLMKSIFNNRKKEIADKKAEALLPEKDVSFTYAATAYYFYDCPSCDGETDEAQIQFANSLDELMKWRKEYRYDVIYRNGKEIAKCVYDIGGHRIHSVKVCNTNKYGDANEEDIIKVYN